MRRLPVWLPVWLLIAACVAPPVVSAEAKPHENKKLDVKRPGGKDDDYYELFKSLADTIDQVEHNYVKDIDRRELFEAAIKGVLDKLDPYSAYISPEELDGFKSSVESQFGGIGIQIGVERGQLKIISPLVGTPAYNAGLLAGDRIVKIDNEPTTEVTLDDAVKRLKGEIGTSVSLSVVHPDATKPVSVTVTRELIHVETVLGDRRGDDDHWDFMLDPDKRIGYIRITAFSRDTAADVKHALENLKSRNVRGLVLDLRFNPGGLLNSAIEICDMFISDGVIVSAEGRNSPKRVWEAHKEGTFEGFPMVVLVNHYSASASEIVSACLQDHGRAVVVGERTWGKGSVQNVIELEEGHSALKLTTASYQRPNGHNIHRFPDSKETDEWGVKPNEGFEVKLNEAELARLSSARRERDILLSKHPKTTILADAQAEVKQESATEQNPEAEQKPEKPAADSATKTSTSSAGDKTHAEKPADAATEKPLDATADATKSKRSDFTDRQLQKGLDYLTAQLSQPAKEAPHKDEPRTQESHKDESHSESQSGD